MDMGHVFASVLEDIAEAHSAADKPVRFFYATCPKCAKVHGQNDVVGLAQI